MDRQLFNPDMYLQAYARIHQTTGAMTKGATDETVDGMSQRRIARSIEAIRYERWRWTPVRRVEIPKRDGKTRPLGMPTWTDKLLQEVIGSMLEAYYEPQFYEHSHGFRPGKGCHTALTEIHRNWVGTKWFIEGDIKGCFDNIDHTILMNILREKIRDNRFLRLVEGALKAGYCEQWTYYPSLSGTPQGGIISPLLANIYLDKLDKYVNDTLIPKYTRGKERKSHPVYKRLQELGLYHRSKGNYERGEALRKEAQSYPASAPYDPEYRRLRYVRYADDFLLGFAGPKAEAEEIKEELGTFLRNELKLTLAKEKTLVTHATTERTHFLSYEIGVMQNQTKFDRNRRRNVNGRIGLYIPDDVIQRKRQAHMKNGKVIHRSELIRNSEFDIISRFQWEYRGLVEYYAMAQNMFRLGYLQWIMETSLLKTLANKNRSTVKKLLRRLSAKRQTPYGPRHCLQLTIQRKGKKPLVAWFGALSLRRRRTAVFRDQVILPHAKTSSQLVDRLLNDTCEVCGKVGEVQVHHIRKLADLKVQGRREKPLWVKVMVAQKRKQLIVCQKCHSDIHHNRRKSVE